MITFHIPNGNFFKSLFDNAPTMTKKQDNKRRKKSGKDDKDDKSLRFFLVTQEEDGALVCECPEFKATGKVCVEILATRLEIDFGPAKPYLGGLVSTY